MVFVHRTDGVGILVLVPVLRVAVRLSMDVDVTVQFSRSLSCRICGVVVTVLYRCLRIIGVSR